MIRATQLVLLAVAVAFVAGCEKEVEQTTANLTGSWKGAFADQVAIISLGGNGTYIIEISSDGTQGSQLFLTSGFGKLQPVGNWRVGDGEVVFSDGKGVTSGGLEIAALYEDRVLFKASDGTTMFFHKVPARATPAIAPPTAPGAGDAAEGMGG